MEQKFHKFKVCWPCTISHPSYQLQHMTASQVLVKTLYAHTTLLEQWNGIPSQLNNEIWGAYSENAKD